MLVILVVEVELAVLVVSRAQQVDCVTLGASEEDEQEQAEEE